jgi:hypothetical protein
MSRQRLTSRSVPTLTVLEDRSVPAGFTAGSIQGQDGWSGGAISIAPEVDQRVDLSGTLARTGTGSFVVSNSTANGNFNGGFAGWPFGPSLSVTTGEPASGAAADVFTATVWFRSVNSTADGSNIEIDLGNVTGSNRVNYLAILNLADGDGGLQIELTEPDPSGNLYFPTAEATNLARGVWHRLDITATFRDGAADSFTVALNGTGLPNTNTGGTSYDTFERFYAAQGQPYQQVNRLYFRSDTAPSVFGFSDTGAQGFAFDDVSYAAALSTAVTSPVATYFAAFESTPSVVYVDPSFDPLPNGTAIPDADPFTPGDQPAVKGVDAFGTLAQGTTAVADGGRVLTFTGSYTGGGSVSPGTTLQLGGPNGTAAVTADAFAFAGGSILSVDINGTAPGTGYDQFTATGGVDIGGATLEITSTFTPAPTDQFILVQSAGGVVGQFANLPEGSVVNLGGFQYKIRYSPTLVVLELDRANVTVTITDNRTTTPTGGANTYTIVVTNNGPRTTTGQMNVQLPAGFIGATFTSVAADGATGNSATGGGAPSDLLTLPAGATVTYTVTGLVLAAPGETLTAFAGLTLPAAVIVDPVPGDNGAIDTTLVTAATTVDVTRPSVQVIPNGTLFGGTAATFSILFSEDVTGLTAGDIFFNNASFVSLSGSGASYVLTVTPGVGQVDVTVAEGAATDAAGNPNTGGTGTATSAAPQLPPPAIRPRFATAVGGVVTVFDPATGTSREFTPYPGFAGGMTVATADLNGDGFQEIVTGAGPGGGPHVKVFDGLSGDEILSFYAYDERFRGGVNVAAGDGRIVTGAGPGGGPHVKAFSSTGAETASYFAYAESFVGGVRVAIGDTNGDGTAEIVTGAGPGAAPHVKVFDGASLAEVASFFAFDPGFTGGVFVAAGDGRLAVGAGAGSLPTVKTYTNRGLTEELSFNAYSTDFNGGVRVALKDANGDGTTDLVTGAGPSAGTHVRGFSLPSLTEVASFYAGPLDPTLGVFVG